MVYWRRSIVDRTDSPLADCPSAVAQGRRHEARVLRVELPRFREQVRNLWQTLLCYFILYRSRWLHRVPPMGVAQPVPVEAERPIPVAGVVTGTSHITETSHIREEIREEIVEIPTILVLWWVPALIFYGLGDTLTTALCYGVGAREANPLAGWLIGYAGGIALFALVKTIIVICLLFISYYWLGRFGWIIPAILTAVGIYLVANNIMAFLAAV